MHQSPQQIERMEFELMRHELSAEFLTSDVDGVDIPRSTRPPLDASVINKIISYELHSCRRSLMMNSAHSLPTVDRLAFRLASATVSAAGRQAP